MKSAAVVMNGSRANPNAPKDLFCDYDVVYYVPEPRRFLEDQSWIPYFGDLVILQQNDFYEHDAEGYIFLMLFTDGVRIDLAFDPLSFLAYLGDDTLTVVLLDKDGRIGSLPPASDLGYHTPRPSRKEFASSINEIFWCSNNIAKGIWRDELPYVKYMLDVVVRPCILEVLAWYAADRQWLEDRLGEVWQMAEKIPPVRGVGGVRQNLHRRGLRRDLGGAVRRAAPYPPDRPRPGRVARLRLSHGR